MTQAFYDDLAEHYHLLFEDWDRSIARQAAVLGPLLERYAGSASLRILDCACGIGTQTLGLALRGHRLVASDLSRASIVRARREARERQLEVAFHVADMRDLALTAGSEFDAVVMADNALPHLLHVADRDAALRQIAGKLRTGGILLLTLRDYDELLKTRLAMQAPSFFGARGERRIVHQVWDWDGDAYDVHLYLSIENAAGWTSMHFVSRYAALRREDVAGSLHRAGLEVVEWLQPGESGYYQPLLIARKEGLDPPS